MSAITVRERLLVDGVWYALGAIENDTVVLREEDVSTTYFFSSNGGKVFYLQSSVDGDQRMLLKTRQPAGGICPDNRTIPDLKFMGQSQSQRKCVELRRLLLQLELISE